MSTDTPDTDQTATATPVKPLSWGTKFAIGLVATVAIGVGWSLMDHQSDLEESVCEDLAAGASPYQVAMELHQSMGWDGPKSLNYVQHTDC